MPTINKEKALLYTEDMLRGLIEAGASDIAAEIRKVQEENKPALLRYLDQFITVNDQMIKLKYNVKILAPYDDPILIQGESGTGKELIAQALHGSRTGAFIPVNCAGLPEYLIESELFGHVKGAFTGAATDRMGMFQAATDGTAFLDEIGELPMVLQAKLLRAIQEKKIRKVGSNIETPINCRLVTATHHNLKSEVANKHFREDLYWRISTIELNTLPLRERIKDIPLLLKHFDVNESIDDYDAFAAKINRDKDLKGNVRSLQQIVKRYELLGIIPGM